MNSSTEPKVAIVGAGLAGLACARRLMLARVPCVILEAADVVGGRVKTAMVEGFTLNYGFQVLQTAYPEARRVLDYAALDLKPFAPGAIMRIDGKFHRIADPRRRPGEILGTLRAPIGSIGDRLRILVILEGQIDDGRNGVFDITGGTFECHSHQRIVFLFSESNPGNPARRLSRW